MGAEPFECGFGECSYLLRVVRSLPAALRACVVLGRGGGKGGRAAWLCLLSTLLATIVFKTSLLPPLFSSSSPYHPSTAQPSIGQRTTPASSALHARRVFMLQARCRCAGAPPLTAPIKNSRSLPPFPTIIITAGSSQHASPTSPDPASRRRQLSRYGLWMDGGAVCLSLPFLWLSTHSSSLPSLPSFPTPHNRGMVQKPAPHHQGLPRRRLLLHHFFSFRHHLSGEVDLGLGGDKELPGREGREGGREGGRERRLCCARCGVGFG